MAITTKILIIGPTQGVGGVRTHVLHLENILNSRKSNIKIVRGVPFYYMLYLSFYYKPDLVIYNLSIYRNQILRDILNRRILAFRKRRHVVHLHGGNFGDVAFAQTCVGRMILKLHFRGFDRIFCLTDKQHQYVSEVLNDQKRIWKINNYVPIPSKDIINKPSSKLNLVYIGRLHPLKGVMEAIKAVQEINSNRVKLWIIGSGELEKDIEKISDPRIIFLGEKNGVEINQYLSLSHAILLPSSWPEGLPYVLVEAASYGLALIATRVGAVDQVLRHGENGFIVDPGDINGIAQRLEYLLENRSLLEKMAIRSLNICKEKFSITALKNIYEDLYTEFSLQAISKKTKQY
jgi:glycosyltransferase involved in cell wall biosynthesis